MFEVDLYSLTSFSLLMSTIFTIDLLHLLTLSSTNVSYKTVKLLSLAGSYKFSQIMIFI